MEHVFGKLVGGRLCLDFVNTVGGRVGGAPGQGRDYADRVVGERLTSYRALAAWSVLAGALTAREAGTLERRAAARPADAAAVLRRCIAVREAIYRTFKSAIEEWPPRPADLETLNREIQIARAHERLGAAPRFEWKWDATPEALDRALWPVVRSAAELLTSADLERLGQCPGESCGWLFLDTSRSRRRQWCDMADCGTVAKVRRFRTRQRTGRTAASTRSARGRRSLGQ
jgi:predicted RNA-binding Zn ribbon-like protein